MKGIEYIVDEKGREKAAIIDLDTYGYLWEDIRDIIVSESRKKEPRIKWEDVKRSRNDKK
ncbi:hypothetical protein J7L68_06745 [bacterium]|nr:hypothetical protein [bacterium]